MRIDVSRGGTPTVEQLAAVTVALTAMGSTARDGSDEPDVSPWAEAATLESHGFRPFDSHSDLTRYHRSIA